MNFSVLISIYEKEDPNFLKTALKSIWNDQTRKPSEIIVVEDGPLTQDLYSVVNQFEAEAPVRVITLSENKGLGEALNIGLRSCNNEFVARMDADDCSLPMRFEKQIEYLTLNPSCDMVGSWIDEYDDDLVKINNKRIVPQHHQLIVKEAAARNPINHMTVMFRRSAVLSAGSYLECLYAEDYHLWLRMIADGSQLNNINEVLVQVRAGSKMIKRRGGLKYIKSEWQIFKAKKKYLGQEFLLGLFYLIVRSVPRLLPYNFRKKVYNIIRKHS